MARSCVRDWPSLAVIRAAPSSISRGVVNYRFEPLSCNNATPPAEVSRLPRIIFERYGDRNTLVPCSAALFSGVLNDLTLGFQTRRIAKLAGSGPNRRNHTDREGRWRFPQRMIRSYLHDRDKLANPWHKKKDEHTPKIAL